MATARAGGAATDFGAESGASSRRAWRLRRTAVDGGGGSAAAGAFNGAWGGYEKARVERVDAG